MCQVGSKSDVHDDRQKESAERPLYVRFRQFMCCMTVFEERCMGEGVGREGSIIPLFKNESERLALSGPVPNVYFKNETLNTRTHSLTHSRTHASMHVLTHARTHARTHPPTHPPTHTHPHTNTHTHTHTHTRIVILWGNCTARVRLEVCKLCMSSLTSQALPSRRAQNL